MFCKKRGSLSHLSSTYNSTSENNIKRGLIFYKLWTLLLKTYLITQINVLVFKDSANLQNRKHGFKVLTKKKIVCETLHLPLLKISQYKTNKFPGGWWQFIPKFNLINGLSIIGFSSKKNSQSVNGYTFYNAKFSCRFSKLTTFQFVGTCHSE